MVRLRGWLLAAVVGTASVAVPAQSAEAGLIDWLRCVLNPCRWPCRTCEPSCEVPAANCAPVVVEGSYSDPCNPCPTPCAVSYVRRSYMEPRTRMTTQSVLEQRPTYVRRRYWDPCSLSYRTYCNTETSLVRRRYCVPVTDYVERSYLQPVVNCPTSTAPCAVPVETAPEPVPAASPAATRHTRPSIVDRLTPSLRPRYGTPVPAGSNGPPRSLGHPVTPSALGNSERSIF